MSKVCTICGEEKPETEFYSYNRKCKKCYNKIRCDLHKKSYTRDSMSIRDLSEEVKANIRKDIDDKMRIKVVAKKYNIKYPTLCHWNRNKNI